MRFFAELLGPFAFIATAGLLFPYLRNNPIVLTIACVLTIASTWFTVKELSKTWQQPSETATTSNLPLSADEIFWLSIKDSAAPGLFEEFVKKFPMSPHAAEAQVRLGRLATNKDTPQQGSSGLSKRFCVTINGKQECE